MKKFVILALVAFLNSLLCLGQIKIDGLNYTVMKDNGTASLESAPTSLSGSFTIPSTISHQGRNYSVVNIRPSAFKDCSKLTSIIIPSSVIVIGRLAFQNCTGLTSIKFPARLTMLEAGAFYNCSSLVSVELPYIHNTYGGFESLSSDLFNGCSSLVYVKIPISIDGIGARAFKDCNNLSDIFCYPTKAPTLASQGGNAFDGTKRGEIRIHVPKESLDSYKNSNWNVFKTIDTNMTRPQIQKQTARQNINSNTREAIDMGVSVEWANMNIEANSPTDPGGAFAWGETTSKKEFTSRNYSAPQLGANKYDYGLRGTNYDAARVKWGNGWRLPTKREFEELIRNCKVIPHSREKYVEIVASNGNKLILPNQPKANITYNGIGDFYWTSDIDYDGSICYDLYFGISNKSGYYGGLLRPVRDKRSRNKQQITYTNPQTNTSQKAGNTPPKEDNNLKFSAPITSKNVYDALDMVVKMCDVAETSEKDKAISLYKDAYELFKRIKAFPQVEQYIYPPSMKTYTNRIEKGLKERGVTLE